MLENTENAGAVQSVVMAGLRKWLASHQAVSLELILTQVGVSREHVIQALEGLVAMREVEVLCPVIAGAGGGRSPTFHPLEHYRLVRSTDRDYEWQVYVTDHPAECSRAAEREWQTVSRMPEAVSDFAWLLPRRRYAYSAG